MWQKNAHSQICTMVAIYNQKFAEAHGGTMFLRAEDTDQKRGTHHEDLFRDLGWLGVQWSEPVVYQSQRAERHRQVAHHLEQAGVAYRCRCSEQRLHGTMDGVATWASPMAHCACWHWNVFDTTPPDE